MFSYKLSYNQSSHKFNIFSHKEQQKQYKNSLNNSVLNYHTIGESPAEDDNDEVLIKTDYKRARLKTEGRARPKYNLKNMNEKDFIACSGPDYSHQSDLGETRNHFTSVQHDNGINDSDLLNYQSEKVANRLFKKSKNATEMGYINFPHRSLQKIKEFK